MGFLMNPLMFHGGLDPMKDHEWITSIKRMFQIVHYNEEGNEDFCCSMVGE